MAADAGGRYCARGAVWMDFLSSCLRVGDFGCSPESVSAWTLESPLFLGLYTLLSVPRNTFYRRSVQSAVPRSHKTSSQRKHYRRLESEYFVLSISHTEYFLGLPNEKIAMVSVLRRRAARTVCPRCSGRGWHVDQR